MTMRSYANFWGCFIPTRFPQMEKATRLSLEILGVDARDLDGFTCCPDKSLLKTMSEEAWLLTAARNLAVAEQAGMDILTACNGCYGTLKTTWAKLAADPAKKRKVNEELAKIGMTYHGDVEVVHLVELLHDKVGIGAIKGKIEQPLNGMRIAAHYGCHMLNPSDVVDWDDSLHPKKFDALIEALGAASIDYDTKSMCCGGNLSPVNEPEEAMSVARAKLVDIQGRADAITTTCPSCGMQYDIQQSLMQRRGEQVGTPLIFYPQLLCLALGVEVDELGFQLHKVDTSAFVEKWEAHKKQLDLARKHFDLKLVRSCYECGACERDCNTARNLPSFRPNELIGMVLEGKIEELINSKEIWECVDCYVCYEMCPQRFGMFEVFHTLRRLAQERGIMPAGRRSGIETFLKNGRLAEPSDAQRKRLGLPSAPGSGAEQIRELLKSKIS